MMDASFIKAIAEVSGKNKTPHVLPIPTEPGKRFAIINPDKPEEITISKNPDAPANHSFASLESLVEYAMTGVKSEGVNFFVDGDKAQTIYAHILGQPYLTLLDWDVKFSPEIVLLKSLAITPGVFAQKDLVKFLRIKLNRCVAGSQIAVFRNLKWTKNQMSAASHQHQGSNIGKSLEAQVTGEQAIPEEITLQPTPVFDKPIRGVSNISPVLIVETDAESERFTIGINGGALDASISGAFGQIAGTIRSTVEVIKTDRKHLKDLPVTVYMGKPSFETIEDEE